MQTIIGGIGLSGRNTKEQPAGGTETKGGREGGEIENMQRHACGEALTHTITESIELTDNDTGIHLWKLFHQIPDNGNSRVIGLSDRKDNLKAWVVLLEAGGQVLVHVAINTTEGTNNGHSGRLVLAHPRGYRSLMSYVSLSARFCSVANGKGGMDALMLVSIGLRCFAIGRTCAFPFQC